MHAARSPLPPSPPVREPSRDPVWPGRVSRGEACVKPRVTSQPGSDRWRVVNRRVVHVIMTLGGAQGQPARSDSKEIRLGDRVLSFVMRSIRSFLLLVSLLLGGLLLLVLPLLGGCQRSAPDGASEDAAQTRGGEEIRYLALGDSFTAGTGNQPDDAFPSRLASLWRADGRRVTLKNVAVNGYTTEDVKEQELPEVAPFRPTLVTLAVGANDYLRGWSADVYRSQLRVLFRAIMDAGVAPSRIVALPQPDWSLSPVAASFGDPRQIGADIVAFNTILRDEARAAGARYVDLYPLMHKQAEANMLASDGLHPSARAHAEWAAALYEQVEP
ncbi:SGNH/GDSL hydrolase family protein [Sorangium sp. So ce385]|uniref:SGNH/GDSL hydrolase family protein n=1 Tax=Sorangium sp. So ce385 TaxID=3133308 RepID=UPI003F5B7A6C